jgi:hypothetical protein
MAIRADKSIRGLPAQVESDIVALKAVQSSAVSHETSVAGEEIRHRLDTYRQDAEFLESRGLNEGPSESKVKEALYSYLCSDQSWGNFRAFERSVVSREYMPLVDRVFARDASIFVGEIGSRLSEDRRVAEIGKFMHLAERSIASWDISAIQALWPTVFDAARRGVIADENALLIAKLIGEHPGMTEGVLRGLLEGLADRPLSDTNKNGQGLSFLGKLLAARVGESHEVPSNQLRSDSRVELGYLASRIHQLSILPATHKNQHALVDLYKRAAEYAQPATLTPFFKSWRDESIATIRSHALQSMHLRSESDAREILDAAMPLLRESWWDCSSVVFRELIAVGQNGPRAVVLYAFRGIISSDCVLYALQEQCQIRGTAPYFRDDRRKLVALLREAIHAEQALGDSRSPIVLTRSIGLLRQLSEEARVAVPDVLAILGIRAWSLGRLGFVASPWSVAPESDADVCAAARSFAQVWKEHCSSGIRKRLE